MGTAGWKLQRRKEEKLSALSQTTVLLPGYDSHGHPELSRKEAHFIRGRLTSLSKKKLLKLFFLVLVKMRSDGNECRNLSKFCI